MSKKPVLRLFVFGSLIFLFLVVGLFPHLSARAQDGGGYRLYLPAIRKDPEKPKATQTPTKVPTKAPTIAPSRTPTRPASAPTATAVSGLTRVTLTKGPHLLASGSSNSMKIFWQWTSNAGFRVDWGLTTSYGSSAAVSAYDTTNHLYSYTITGLTPGAKYHYRVVTGSQYAPGSFLAPPSASATDLKFVSYGDSRTNGSVHNTVAGQVIALYKSDSAYQTIIPFMGDAIADGNLESDWKNEFFNPSYTNIREELASMLLMPVMGNHEGTGTLFKRYFPEPFAGGRYWSMDYGPAHFVMLDQYTSYSSGSTQYNWLKNDLAASTKKWKIVVLHAPGWSAGYHPNNSTVQNVLQPLFEQHNVAMVLGGHNHYYARASVNGIQHLTIGTAGAPLSSTVSGQPNVVKSYKGYGYARFAISGNTLTGWFVDTSGTVRDTFTITR